MDSEMPVTRAAKLRREEAVGTTLPGFPLQPSDILREHHYLGPIKGGRWYEDEDGVLVFDAPTARGLPSDWLELVRWCIVGGHGAGSRQWKRALSWVRSWSSTSTIVSYSDPSAGHTGALYRACGWIWAPTWHRLRPPPTGNGEWTKGQAQSVKDRWVYPLTPDDRRAMVLAVKDDACRARFPNAEYREPRWKRGKWTPCRALTTEGK